MKSLFSIRVLRERIGDPAAILPQTHAISCFDSLIHLAEDAQEDREASY
jgi:hypothetical protein